MVANPLRSGFVVVEVGTADSSSTILHTQL